MAIKKGLGKGLDALLGDYQQPPEESVKEIDVNLIDTNSSQPRKSFDKEKLDELAAFLYEKETITGEEFMEILNKK